MAQENRPPGWRHTVAELGPGLGGIGSLLVGLAAVLALVVANMNGGDQAPATPSRAPSQTLATEPSAEPATAVPSATAATAAPSSGVGSPPAEPAFTDLLFSNDLDDPVRGIFAGTIRSCVNEFDEGYHITTGDQYVICPGALGDASTNLRNLTDVRVEVAIEFAPFTDDPAETYGPGDGGVWCRGVGSLGTGDYYLASIGPIGYWAIVKFVDGQQETLDGGIAPELETAAGERRELRFDCYGEPGGPTVLRLAVDGEEIGSAIDSEGLAAGDVGMATTNFGSRPITVTYRDVSVFGAE